MPTAEDALLEPQARIKLLCNQGNAVEVDNNIPVRRLVTILNIDA